MSRRVGSDDREHGQNGLGGGVFLALGSIIGVIAGGLAGQPSAGLLIGLALGVAVALALWWRERG